MDREELMKYLPHREPMLLVDEVEIDDAGALAAVAVYIIMGALIGEVTPETKIADATPALMIALAIFVIAFITILFTKIEEPEQAPVDVSLIKGIAENQT